MLIPLILTVVLLNPNSRANYKLSDYLMNELPNPTYKYTLDLRIIPIEPFMPKDRAHWNWSYFVSHPRNIAVAQYILENEFYKDGMDGVGSQLSDLRKFLVKNNSGELSIDFLMLSEVWQNPKLKIWVAPYGSRPLNMSRKSMALSLPQALIMTEFGFGHRDKAKLCEWLLSAFPKSSEAFLLAALQGDFILMNPPIPHQIKIAVDQRAYFTVSRVDSYYRNAIQLNPDLIPTWYYLEMHKGLINDPRGVLEACRKVVELCIKQGRTKCDMYDLSVQGIKNLKARGYE